MCIWFIYRNIYWNEIKFKMHCFIKRLCLSSNILKAIIWDGRQSCIGNNRPNPATFRCPSSREYMYVSFISPFIQDHIEVLIVKLYYCLFWNCAEMFGHSVNWHVCPETLGQSNSVIWHICKYWGSHPQRDAWDCRVDWM